MYVERAAGGPPDVHGHSSIAYVHGHVRLVGFGVHGRIFKFPLLGIYL